jgi:recombination endonuclease VII
MGSNLKKITGKKFGMLTVLQDAKPPTEVLAAGRRIRNRYVLCQCDCGRKTSVRVDHLRSHKTRSCGCQASELLWTRALKAVVSENGLSWTQAKKQIDELGRSAVEIAAGIEAARVVEQERQAEIPKPSEKEARFGLSAGEYDRMLLSQEGVCAICQEPPGCHPLHVDHCHATGRVRGLLCRGCNHGLGNFKDDIMRLAKAMKYLTTERT